MTVGLLGSLILGSAHFDICHLITLWQNQTLYIHCGGIPQASFPGTSPAGLGTNLTVIQNNGVDRIIQDGYIRQVVIQFYSATTGGTCKVKVFRINGANWDFVGESEVLTVPTGATTQTYTLAQPIPCQPGDVVGWWGGAGVYAGQIVGKNIRYAAGDITGTNAFASPLAVGMTIDVLGRRPYLAFSGDSIPSGGHCGSHWHSKWDAEGVAGTPTSEIANQLRGILADGLLLEYQNHAMDGSLYSWVAATGAPAAIATQARKVLIHCGTNDIMSARTWANVEADLNTIKAALLTGQQLLIDEINPRTPFSDAMAVTTRTWNANLSTWCAANSARLVKCHDPMGQVRGATGELDDLLAAYSFDGIHCNQAGVDYMAQIWKGYL